MDQLLDDIWAGIERLLVASVNWMDGVLFSVEVLGPEVVIFLLALFTVLTSAILRHFYTTKRYLELKEKFEYWYQLKQEAIAHNDEDTGKAIGKNIDQAELNRAYYDFFFEGLLKNLVTTWLPIFIVLAYVNMIYRPERLLNRFGSDFLFSIGSEPNPQKISSLFWFFLSLIFSSILVSGIKILYKKSKPVDIAENH